MRMHSKDREDDDNCECAVWNEARQSDVCAVHNKRQTDAIP